MKIATALGIESASAPVLHEAQSRWKVWIQVEPDLDIGLSVPELPGWTWRRDPRTDDALRALVRLGSPCGYDDAVATTVLAWLLSPGATSIARQLADRATSAHEMTASALWIACREADPDHPSPIAARVLRTTKRAVQAELGLGEGGRRADRAWSATSTRSPQWAGWEAAFNFGSDEVSSGNAVVELRDLMEDAKTAGVITASDCQLLVDVAVLTDELEGVSGRAAKREACGLGNRYAAEVMSRRLGISERTIRRRLRRCIDQLTEFSGSSRMASA